MALQESPELREVFSRVYHALLAGSASPVLAMMSSEEGMLSIGTDPKEWCSDFPTLERVFSAQLPQMRGTGIRFETSDPQCYQEGTVGWCADLVRIILPDDTAQLMRITAVFHREAGSWKIVQSHASLGVPNADAFGTDLTT